jgi:hypothetical protein
LKEFLYLLLVAVIYYYLGKLILALGSIRRGSVGLVLVFSSLSALGDTRFLFLARFACSGRRRWRALLTLSTDD